MDDIAISCLDINPETVQAVMLLTEELRKVGVTLNDAKMVALPSMDHAQPHELFSADSTKQVA